MRTGETRSSSQEESAILQLDEFEHGKAGLRKTDTASRVVEVGMVGTFDIENYGDLLFPLIAAEALRRRDQCIRVVPFSANGRSEPGWPFLVRPVEEMAGCLSKLSAMLIGGGQILRFDKFYPVGVPASADIPIAYWLVPAVQAALAGKPVIWNAVGAWTGSPRSAWHEELLRQVLAASCFIGVRDAASVDYLARIAPDAGIEFLPDTAFGLSRLWPLEQESTGFTNWRRSLGLDGKYIVIQANAALGCYRSTIESQMQSAAISGVVLPVCWCHGDRAEEFPEMKGRVFSSRQWLPPKLISEIIGRSEFVFASSLHTCITAISYGVPVARAQLYSERKYELLDGFEGIVHINDRNAVSRLLRRGRRTEPKVKDYADQLDRYWDKVRDLALQPPVEHCDRSRSLMLCWVAKACKRPRRLEVAQRLATILRKSLVRQFPLKRRVAIRHRLLLVSNWLALAFQYTARSRMSTRRAGRKAGDTGEAGCLRR
ncbi:MAG: polysaccharide pyruvyl transferase family protein [Candidatus Sulfotelmatobacter sp.]